ncbi:uncharacterized protein LOC144109761 [Amblyomma americanum]
MTVTCWDMLYKNFLACIEILCSSQSDIGASLNHFTVVLTEGYEEMCKIVTEPCTRLRLLRDFFYCGTHYYKSYNQVGLWFRFAQSGVCELLESFRGCLKNASIGCEGFSQLIARMEAVQKYMAAKHGSACTRPQGATGVKDKRGFLRLDWQTLCDQQRAVKNLVLCGVAFDRMLRFAENSSVHAPDRRLDAVCP